jgi:hypothetical protein
MKTSVTVVTYTCDLCGAQKVGATWTLDGHVRLRHGLQDWQGSVVAGYDHTWQLCDRCVGRVRDAIDALKVPEEVHLT